MKENMKEEISFFEKNLNLNLHFLKRKFTFK